MSEIARIVEQLEQVHEGEAWLHHVRVTGEAVRAHLTGEPAAGEPDWLHAGQIALLRKAL